MPSGIKSQSHNLINIMRLDCQKANLNSDIFMLLQDKFEYGFCCNIADNDGATAMQALQVQPRTRISNECMIKIRHQDVLGYLICTPFAVMPALELHHGI